MNEYTDRIKSFIAKHRDAFDARTPDAHLWNGIARSVDRHATADSLERFLLENRVLLDTEAPPANGWKGIENALDQANPDALERFIRQNRDALDDQLPDAGIWERIGHNMPDNRPAPPPMQVHWGRKLTRIAAAIALLISGVALGILFAPQLKPAEPTAMRMADISSEYAELEKYYKQDIRAKKQKLASFASARDQSVLQDIQQMDQAMDELQAELASVPPGNREQVIRAMIDNYKAKIAILQRVINRMEEREQSTKNSNSTNNERESI